MFDIGFMELVLIGIVSLIVIGPERLPGAIRTATLWIGRAKRSFNQVKSEIEREINTDEIRRQLHNESILADLEKAKTKADNLIKDTKKNIDSINAEVNAEVNAVLKEEAEVKTASEKTSSAEKSIPKILAKTPETELDPATLDEEPLGEDTLDGGARDEKALDEVIADDDTSAEQTTVPPEPTSIPTPSEPITDFYNNPSEGRVQIQGNTLRASATEQKDDDSQRQE